MMGYANGKIVVRTEPARSGLVAALVLLTVAAAAVVGATVLDPPRQAASPEASIRAYFTALEMGDAGSALMRIAPAARARWVDFVENGLLNEYRVLGVAVRHASVVDRLRGEPSGPRDATVFVEITEAVSGHRWRAGPRVPVVFEDGVWYLSRPPLAA
jgi:hypothetical protein